ncbi:MAG: SDR family oxidoreductase [Deltaproteobacteria bacterium]|nr:SDR family oxidoreductase [Deltaproteobacteria bacterium]
MRTLIVGASGLVGGALRAELPAATGTYLRHPAAGLLPLDITDAAAVDALVDRLRPALVLLPAAEPAVDRCETDPAESERVNVHGTGNVARAAARIGARFVYFSSDYVFDGTAGPYEVDAAPHPINVYGRHKLAAEALVRATVADHLIVRVCGVYGYQPEGKNFVMALARLGAAGEAMRVPSDQWGTPTYAPNLAAAVRELAASDHRGIVHPVGPDYLTRIDFARLAAEVLGHDDAFLVPVTTPELRQPAARPLRGGVANRSTQALLRTTRLVGAREGLGFMRRRLEAAAAP